MFGMAKGDFFFLFSFILRLAVNLPRNTFEATAIMRPAWPCHIWRRREQLHGARVHALVPVLLGSEEGVGRIYSPGAHLPALRLAGGFDKLADDDSSFAELRDLVDDACGNAAQARSTKELMNRQVEKTTQSLQRMSRLVERAAERAKSCHDDQPSPRCASDSSEGSGLERVRERGCREEGSSGVGAEDGVEGDVDDYFEVIGEPRENSRGRGQILGGEMLRQPINMPKQVRLSVSLSLSLSPSLCLSLSVSLCLIRGPDPKSAARAVVC